VKVLFTSDLFAPAIGGTELVVQAMAAEQIARGNTAVVATMTPGRGTPDVIDGVPVIRIATSALYNLFVEDVDRPYHPPMPVPRVVRALRQLQLEHDFDVIVAHNWIVYSALIMAKEFDVPVVWYLHDYLLTCPKRTKLYVTGEPCPGASLRRCVPCASSQYGKMQALGITLSQRLSNDVLLSRVSYLIANSQDTAAKAQEANIASIPLAVLPPAFEPRPPRDDERPGFLPQGDYILFVGQLSTHKGLDDLLAAFERLERPSVSLVCIGTRQDSTPHTWPENVTVVERVPHEDVMRAWRHCVLGVLPSKAESFGLVALEAGVVGRPMIVSDIGVLASLIEHERTGLVVPSGDVVALTAAMQRLIDEPSWATELGANARESVSQYSVQANGDKLNAILHQVIASSD